MKNWAPTVSAMSAMCLAIVAVATVSVAANEFVREREKTLNERIALVESDVRALKVEVAKMASTQTEMLDILRGLAKAEKARTKGAKANGE